MGLDRCRIFVTGSAPIAPYVKDFVRIVFGRAIAEGFGQTEGCCGCCASPVDDVTVNSAGGPLATTEVQLLSVPEMGYHITDTVHGKEVEGGVVTNPGAICHGRGEVLYRTLSNMSGYYKNPEATAEALDADGWIHSGDIGMWDERGGLKIIDRKKALFKLAQGEYVAPEKLENLFAQSPYVGAIFVHGDSLHSTLVAVVCIDHAAAKAWATSNGRPTEDIVALANEPGLKKAVLDDISRIAKVSKLNGFEVPKAVFLDAAAWEIGSLVTPTFKLKRHDARQYYAASIRSMYADIDSKHVSAPGAF